VSDEFKTPADAMAAPREGSLDAPLRHRIAWQDDEYYDLAKVEAELERQFDVCHTCRRCFNLCDAFPRLFDLIDESPTGELDSVPKADYAKVDEACTLCDMCFLTKCPYVPPHPFDLDFPHLILRYRAAKRKAGEREFVREQLGKTDIRAPMTGRVVALPIKVGETAIPSTLSFTGAQLLTIADTSALQAELKVDEGDIARISEGQTVDIYPAAWPDLALKGVVDKVALTPTVENNARAYKVTVKLAARSDIKLRSGMSCRSVIYLGDGGKRLAVPVEAILSEETEGHKTRRYLMRVVNSVAEKREVQIGISDDRWQEVKQEAEAGDSIVIGPSKDLRELKAGDKGDAGHRKKHRRGGGRPQAMIRLTDIRKSYRMGDEAFLALAGVSLDIARNEYVALVGPSGSGKSTLMNLLGCLDTPSSGEYLLNGRNVATLSDTQLAHIRNQEIGFVFQSFHLLPRLTVLQNVAQPLVYRGMPAAQRLALAGEALERVGLAQRLQHRPNQLSGGQRQRVAIARALVGKPSLLLADEPTGNLDSKTSDEIMALFDALYADGQTLVVVTHEPDIARHCRRTVHLADGCVVSDSKIDSMESDSMEPAP